MANKLDEIQGVASAHKCDIFVITESWLTSKISDDLIAMPGYVHVRKDRPDDHRGGGLCTFIANNIRFFHLQNLDDPNFETQWFLLKPNRLPRGINSIIVATIYHPPGNDDYLLRNHIYQNLDNALNTHPNSAIILLGDFNQFKPGSLCTSFKLKKHVHSPTRGSNTLDQIYSSLINFYDKAKILPPVGKSDHACILLEPTVKNPESFPSSRTLKRSCRPSEKQSLAGSLTRTNWTPLYRANAVEEKLGMFMNEISRNMNKDLPLRYVKNYPMDKPWITTNIKNSIKRRQRALVNGNFPSYTYYRRKVSKLCKRARRSFYSSTVKQLKECNPKKWWNNIKRLSGLSNKQQLTSIHHNGRILMGHELTDHIAKLFCNVAKDIPPLNFTPVEVALVPEEYIISPSDVYNALICINVHKASGPDEIPNLLFKSNAITLCSPVASIYNASIREGKVPPLWKSANVLPILKKNTAQITDDDLRPISLTPTISKILEGFVFKWVFDQIAPYIDRYQYGNMKKCSTTLALIHMIHHWLAATDSTGSVIRACMIDFSKAFDRIDHNILIKKLQALGVHPCLINWCADFVRCRYL